MGARARRGDTQASAAAAVGRSLRTWKSWENGGATPIARHLRSLASYTGLSLNDLVRLIQHEAKGSTVPGDAQAAVVNTEAGVQ